MQVCDSLSERNLLRGVQKPQCVLCSEALCIKTRRRLESKHYSLKEKPPSSTPGVHHSSVSLICTESENKYSVPLTR